MKKLYDADIKIIIKKYKSGKSLYSLAKEFNVRYTSIKYHLLKHNIQLRVGNQNKTYSCNDSFFSTIDSNEKAYWVGFLAADGSVSDNRNTVAIGLSIKDINHLEKFKTSIKSNSRIFKYNVNAFNKNYPACNITIYSKQMVKDLSMHSIIPRKSKILKFSNNIPAQFINSYILGLVDGDGSWIGPDKQNQLRFDIVSTQHVLHHIRDYFIQNCNVNKNKIIPDNRSDHAFYLRYGGNNVTKRIVRYLYNNSIIYLDRKRNKIAHLI